MHQTKQYPSGILPPIIMHQRVALPLPVCYAPCMLALPTRTAASGLVLPSLCDTDDVIYGWQYPNADSCFHLRHTDRQLELVTPYEDIIHLGRKRDLDNLTHWLEKLSTTSFRPNEDTLQTGPWQYLHAFRVITRSPWYLAVSSDKDTQVIHQPARILLDPETLTAISDDLRYLADLDVFGSGDPELYADTLSQAITLGWQQPEIPAATTVIPLVATVGASRNSRS